MKVRHSSPRRRVEVVLLASGLLFVLGSVMVGMLTELTLAGPWMGLYTLGAACVYVGMFVAEMRVPRFLRRIPRRG